MLSQKTRHFRFFTHFLSFVNIEDIPTFTALNRYYGQLKGQFLSILLTLCFVVIGNYELKVK